MNEFIKGLDLCEGFFFDEAKPLLEKYYPNLKYTAGLIGYGSDVLGYDDNVSVDHMWGPRFYLFLDKTDIDKRQEIEEMFSANLPYTYKGFSVNFDEPDENDAGVRHPKFISKGKISSLIYIYTFEDFFKEYLGRNDIDNWNCIDWLSFSEHRLLGLTAGKLFVDMLDIESIRNKLSFYPEKVRLYLIASNWNIISSEQAFVRRCGDCGDDIGSRIITARIAEHLMRLCFLYKKQYAPYSKWFGTAFNHLNVNSRIKECISKALSVDNLLERENYIVKAQSLVGELHNSKHITDNIDCSIKDYYGRDIKVIFADEFSNAIAKKLKGTQLENLPLISSFSQNGVYNDLVDEPYLIDKTKKIYENLI